MEQCFLRSLALGRKAFGDHHCYVGLVLHELAVTLHLNHKEEQAENYFRQCLGIASEYGLDHPKTTILLANFTACLQRRGKQAEVLELLDQALQVRRKRYPANHYSIADIRVIQAVRLKASDPSHSRQNFLREALTIYCQSGTGTGFCAIGCVQQLADDLSVGEVCDLAGTLAITAARFDQQPDERNDFWISPWSHYSVREVGASKMLIAWSAIAV